MEDLESLEKKLQAKLKNLKFMEGQTLTTIEKGHPEGISRHLTNLQTKVSEICDMKVEIQDMLFVETEQHILDWSADIEAQISNSEKSISDLQNRDKQFKESVKAEAFKVEMSKEKAKLEQKYEYDLKAAIESSKSSSINIKQGTKVNAKLPKLEISPFTGSVLDFNRFIGLFEAEIDKSDLAPVTKYAHLKELVVPKVRSLIDGLPFNAEGYERAKNILKTKYGKPSEIANAHMQGISSLPVIQGSNSSKINEFYETLLMHVQALETMRKLMEVTGYVRMTLDKLPGIRADLVRLDDDWHSWQFHQLVEALRKWCERNPAPTPSHIEFTQGSPKPQGQGQPKPHRRERYFQARDQDYRPKGCVYCKSDTHRAVDCDSVKGVVARRKILSEAKLCFNCTGAKHRADQCRSKTNCQHCSGRHHTSICDKERKPPAASEMMLASNDILQTPVVYPVVVVKAGGITCRAMLDTGAGGSYVSSQLIERLGKKPIKTEFKHIDMMLTTASRKISVYELGVESVEGDLCMKLNVNRVERDTLMNLPNPHYENMIAKYAHLKGVEMGDTDDKDSLPVHLILGASEISKIKTQTRPRVGKPGEPIAELTKLGWVIMSPGVEAETGTLSYARTSTEDYEKLCSLDILGLEDGQGGEQNDVYEDFKQQLERSGEGWYQTGLLWKPGNPVLPSNKGGSLARLNNLIKKLERNPGLYEECRKIIREQEEVGIIERAPTEPNGREFYIPFKPIVKESAQTSRTRLVYDASTRATNNSPSLNDCLETGPPLQNLIFDITARNRFAPVTLSGDLRKAFLSVRIKEEDRDALRFHFVDEHDPSKTIVYRFTRAAFGLTQSPFLLGGTLEQHLNGFNNEYPMEVEAIKRSLYVDDILLGGATRGEVQNLKDTAVKIFQSADFHLHKWHSNDPALEATGESTDEGEVSFAKEQLNPGSDETKILGVAWNKATDHLAVTFPKRPGNETKRKVLSDLAAVYDPLGLASPITVQGKMIYRDICDHGLKWDEELPTDLKRRWLAYGSKLPERIEVPRSIPRHRESIQAIDLHGFGDASGNGTSAAVYAVVHQESGTSQGLLAAKSRLAKKGLTIPRLELVGGQMVARLTDNVRAALEGLPIRSCHGWLDSTVALYWIGGQGSYKQFVSNRVADIQSKSYIQWGHVSTVDNPADVGSRGCHGNKLPDQWLNGPEWLAEPENWPSQDKLEASKDSESEAKPVKLEHHQATEVKQEDVFDKLLVKHSYWKTMRITALVRRFIHNTRSCKRDRQKGVLKTEEIQAQVNWWMKRIQQRHLESDKMKEDIQRLNLEENEEGLLECRGRIEGHYPLYLPPNTMLAEKLVTDAHSRTLHGGVGMTMTRVRERYWIPRLRSLTKRMIKSCHGCKKFRATPFPKPGPGWRSTQNPHSRNPSLPSGRCGLCRANRIQATQWQRS